jgi:Tfp pilus assembly protein PilE
MYSVTITRTRTDANTALYILQKSETYINYHNETYANTTTTQSAHFSDDGLTHTVIRLSEDRTVLENFIAEFSNTASPMYESVEYEKENGITLTFSDITEVVDTANT